MKPTTYVCEQYPALSLGGKTGREVKFRRGRFIATEDWQKNLIENNEWYGCFITAAPDHTTEPVRMDPIPVVRPHRNGTATDIEDFINKKAQEAARKAAQEAPPPIAEIVKPPQEEASEPEAESSGYQVSESATKILEKAGISISEAAERLGLADGDRLTVKMAEGLANG